MVCPPLHHSSTIGHPFRSVVGAPYFVSFYMCELTFNPITVEEIALIQDCGSHSAEAVSSGPAVIPHPIKGIEHGVARHAATFARRRENIAAVTSEGTQLAEYRDSLA
jgi:hypothetical protein